MDSEGFVTDAMLAETTVDDEPIGHIDHRVALPTELDPTEIEPLLVRTELNEKQLGRRFAYFPIEGFAAVDNRQVTSTGNARVILSRRRKFFHRDDARRVDQRLKIGMETAARVLIIDG